MWTKMLHLVLGSVLLAGCLGDVPDGLAPPVGGTSDRLQSTLEVGLAPGSCRVVMTAQRQYQGDIARQIELPVLGGTVALRSWPDGRLEFEDLRVDLDDVVFDEYDLPPDGVRLTGIALTLRDVGEVEAKWVEEGAQLEAKGQIDLLLEWTAITPGGAALPLGTQRVTAVAVEVEVSTTDDGKALVKLHGRRHGEFVEVAGIFAISELGIELRAVG
jgi:hypothetical protein